MHTANVIGRLGADPELITRNEKRSILVFDIACQRSRSDVTDWFTIKLFGPYAETMQQYLSRGTLVAVAGKLRQERWKGSDGEQHKKVVIWADEVKALDGPRRNRPALDEGASKSAKNDVTQKTGSGQAVEPEIEVENTGFDDETVRFDDDLPW